MCFHQEQEIVQLRKEIEILQDPTKFQASGVVSPVVEKLQLENAKLTYQLDHLKRVWYWLLLPQAFCKICLCCLFFVPVTQNT